MDRLFVLVLLFCGWASLATAQPTLKLDLIDADKLHAIEGADKYHWIRTDWGVIATSEPASVQDTLREQAAAEIALAQQFDVTGLRGAVVEAALADQADEIKDAFDLDWVMPWAYELFDVSLSKDAVEPSEEQKASIREQITEQLSVGGRTPNPVRLEAVYQQALTQYAEQHSDADPSTDTDQTVKPLRHEIAHKLFIAAVWPPIEGKPAYGGGAPDWLDEVAAILAEDEVLTASRRTQIRKIASQDKLIPLETFFSMQHPAYEGALEMVRRFKEANGDGSTSGVYSFSAEDFEAAGIDLDADAGKFYAQARGFIDYLDSRASGAKPLAVITDGLMDGRSLADTLADEGKNLGIPASIKELEKDFFTWLRQS
ncbi:MAG: hypothetical protein AAFX02_03530 [Pseudomonadota bacterium]